MSPTTSARPTENASLLTQIYVLLVLSTLAGSYGIQVPQSLPSKRKFAKTILFLQMELQLISPGTTARHPGERQSHWASLIAASLDWQSGDSNSNSRCELRPSSLLQDPDHQLEAAGLCVSQLPV